MKKLIIVSTAVIVILLMLITLNKDTQTGISLIITLGVFFILFMSYFYFEKSNSGTKEIAVIATLSAFAAVSRMVFAPIPNVKPVTFLVAISGFAFGPYEGFLIGSTAAFLSNIFFGQGPWTPWQMFSWGLVGILSGVWGKRGKGVSAITFSIVCFVFGFMFDWIMNIWYVSAFIKPISIKSIIGAYIAGLTFDILHGGGSFIFSIIFYDSFLPVLKRYKMKLDISYIK
ncbi:membrane protein [Clostridium carboxidivorans P7]|uniref:Putative metal ion ABC transporter, membrane-spanning subunit n=1 Tax=Clostridium carboxidivorans P7 TaxID=536227 RepID=C6PRJ2_9CLOT|nr:ECF transporter S component [Clostridium carboxidivorans]AKN31473.1 membrane protein [Clostridium carboxidivorans P7]EET88173.1 putative metal ion ABC transporter, membrane-spanning subunit [Clostridium carboxidivorans P7]EFG87132.1 membrane protein, putative [Clostridium carboxidivorans P7]